MKYFISYTFKESEDKIYINFPMATCTITTKLPIKDLKDVKLIEEQLQKDTKYAEVYLIAFSKFEEVKDDQ